MAIFYVNTASTGTGDGTTTAIIGAQAAFKTIAEVNASSFSAGDSILFNKGCTWREQLTVPSSGSAGLPITFGAYGSGENPIINGSTIKDCSGATLVTGNSIVGSQATHNFLNFNLNNATSQTWWAQQWGATETFDVTQVDLLFLRHGTITAGKKVWIEIWDNSGHDPNAIITNGTSSLKECADIGTSETGVTFTFSTPPTLTNGTTYHFVVKSDYDQSAVNFLEFHGVASAAAPFAQIHKYTPWAAVANYTAYIVIYKSGDMNYTYQVAQTSDPGIVWENNAVLSLQTSIATVEATAGSWWWDTSVNLLYINASDSSNVATNGKVYSIASALTENIDTNGKNYITIDGVDCVCTYGSDSTLGGILVSGTNTIVKNLTASGHRRHGITLYTGSSNGLIDNATLYDSTSTSILAVYNSATNTVQNSTLYQTISQSNAFLLRIHGSSDDTIVQNNTFYNCLGGPVVIQIYDAGTTNAIIRKNLFYGTMGSSISAADHTGLEVYDNIFLTSSSSAATILLSTTTGSHIYNNTFYGTAAQFAVSQTNTSTGTLVKNNIFYTGKYASVGANSQTDTVYNYNLYYGGSATPFTWTTTAYNFADWKTNSSQDANSLNADPLFVSTSDFHLQLGSPAINAGVDVGLTSDYEGKHVPRGSAPDIGAYEYQSINIGAIHHHRLRWQ